MPPAVRTVVRDPQAAVVAGEDLLRVCRIDEHVMHIAMHAVEAADRREAPAAVVAGDQRAVGLEEVLRILRVDDQVRKVERAPDHPLALVALLPGGAAVVGDEQRGVDGLDERIDRLGVRRRDAERDAAIGLCRQARIRGRRQLLPGPAAIGAAVQGTARRGVGAGAAGAEGPAPAPEIPQAREQYLWILRVHRDARTAGREVGTLQHQLPVRPAVGGLVQPACRRVAPQLAGHAGVDRIRGTRVDEDLRDALGIRQPCVGPGLAAIG